MLRQEQQQQQQQQKRKESRLTVTLLLCSLSLLTYNCAGFQTPTSVQRINNGRAVQGRQRTPQQQQHQQPHFLHFMASNGGLADEVTQEIAVSVNAGAYLKVSGLDGDEALLNESLDKRVIVSIRYTGDASLKPYYLTVAQKLKAKHPDILLEKLVLPSLKNGGNSDMSSTSSSEKMESTFEVLVDGKVVVGKGRSRRERSNSNNGSVFVSMQELDLAIARARKRRRPTTVYGEDSQNNLRLEMLRNKYGTTTTKSQDGTAANVVNSSGDTVGSASNTSND